MDRKNFMGFGFGPIQAGLMLYEATRSNNFKSCMVAEIDQDLVDRVRRNNNSIVVNIARTNGIEKAVLSGIAIYNPQVPGDREEIAKAVREADELATAVPGVSLYEAGGRSSIADLLAENIDPLRPRILYAAENNNYAAEILKESLLKRTEIERLKSLQILNTVIGKMSGTIQGAEEIGTLGLEPITPGFPRAYLVEEFNRILVSRVRLPGVVRGITVFQEKEDLLPYEEAKLFGHNAIHAVLGYLAHRKGYTTMNEIGNDGALFSFGCDTLIEESGAMLIRKYRSIQDPLFTESGFRDYAQDLIRRIVNPYLNDRVLRICRDPVRKLGYGDRLVGTMREALKQGITPRRLALGAFAALEFIIKEKVSLGVPIPEKPQDLDERGVRRMLHAIWAGEEMDGYRDTCLDLVAEAGKTRE
ncbi:MAG TPA: hypothetical protein VMX75_01055 [Spirochaetia bacterium]|nr:hypothetical protein [Spirochaetia bacterium]